MSCISSWVSNLPYMPLISVASRSKVRHAIDGGNSVLTFTKLDNCLKINSKLRKKDLHYFKHKLVHSRHLCLWYQTVHINSEELVDTEDIEKTGVLTPFVYISLQ